MGWGKLADLADEYGINSDEVEEYLEKLRDKGSDIPDVWDEMDDDEKESQVDAIYAITKNVLDKGAFRARTIRFKLDKYIKSEHFQSLSGLEQVRDLIGIGLRDVIIHADEVMHLFRLRQYIFEKKMLSYGEMEVGSSLLEENIP